MVAPAVAAAGIGAIGSIFGGMMGGKGAKKAAKYQYKAAKLAIEEQRAAREQARADFEPFRAAGVSGLGAYGNLIGIGGAENQAAAMEALRASPYYQSLYRNSEEAVLQNAAATGGIRGGNTQTALFNNAEDMFARTIDRQLAGLGGLISVGQGATGAVTAAGQNAANNIGGHLTQMGQAQAGSALTQAGIWSGVINNLGRSISGALFPAQGGMGQPAYGGF